MSASEPTATRNGSRRIKIPPDVLSPGEAAIINLPDDFPSHTTLYVTRKKSITNNQTYSLPNPRTRRFKSFEKSDARRVNIQDGEISKTSISSSRSSVQSIALQNLTQTMKGPSGSVRRQSSTTRYVVDGLNRTRESSFSPPFASTPNRTFTKSASRERRNGTYNVQPADFYLGNPNMTYTIPLGRSSAYNTFVKPNAINSSRKSMTYSVPKDESYLDNVTYGGAMSYPIEEKWSYYSKPTTKRANKTNTKPDSGYTSIASSYPPRRNVTPNLDYSDLDFTCDDDKCATYSCKANTTIYSPQPEENSYEEYFHPPAHSTFYSIPADVEYSSIYDSTMNLPSVPQVIASGGRYLSSGSSYISPDSDLTPSSRRSPDNASASRRNFTNNQTSRSYGTRKSSGMSFNPPFQSTPRDSSYVSTIPDMISPSRRSPNSTRGSRRNLTYNKTNKPGAYSYEESFDPGAGYYARDPSYISPDPRRMSSSKKSAESSRGVRNATYNKTNRPQAEESFNPPFYSTPERRYYAQESTFASTDRDVASSSKRSSNSTKDSRRNVTYIKTSKLEPDVYRGGYNATEDSLYVSSNVATSSSRKSPGIAKDSKRNKTYNKSSPGTEPFASTSYDSSNTNEPYSSRASSGKGSSKKDITIVDCDSDLCTCEPEEQIEISEEGCACPPTPSPMK